MAQEKWPKGKEKKESFNCQIFKSKVTLKSKSLLNAHIYAYWFSTGCPQCRANLQNFIINFLVSFPDIRPHLKKDQSQKNCPNCSNLQNFQPDIYLPVNKFTPSKHFIFRILLGRWTMHRKIFIVKRRIL